MYFVILIKNKIKAQCSRNCALVIGRNCKVCFSEIHKEKKNPKEHSSLILKLNSSNNRLTAYANMCSSINLQHDWWIQMMKTNVNLKSGMCSCCNYPYSEQLVFVRSSWYESGMLEHVEKCNDDGQYKDWNCFSPNFCWQNNSFLPDQVCCSLLICVMHNYSGFFNDLSPLVLFKEGSVMPEMTDSNHGANHWDQFVFLQSSF